MFLYNGETHISTLIFYSRKLMPQLTTQTRSFLVFFILFDFCWIYFLFIISIFILTCEFTYKVNNEIVEAELWIKHVFFF